MFPLDATHPIMREPNSALSFTKVTSYWWDETLANIFDIGDWVKITSGGDAKLLVRHDCHGKNDAWNGDSLYRRPSNFTDILISPAQL